MTSAIASTSTDATASISCRLLFLLWLISVQRLAGHFKELKTRIEEMVNRTGQPAVILSHSYGASTCNSIRGDA